jgi:hypothetical protein
MELEKGISTGIKKDNESINPQKEPLTVEKLKTFEGFENIADEEALEIIYTIDSLCRAVYEYGLNQHTVKNSNPQNLAA